MFWGGIFRWLLPDSVSFDDYVDIDKDVETCETLNEQSILTELLNLHHEEEEEEDGEVDGEDNQETSELTPICSLDNVKKHLKEIRPYLGSCAHKTDSDF